MTRDFRVVDANLTLQEFADKYLESSKDSIYFAASDGRYRGLVSTEALSLINRNFSIANRLILEVIYKHLENRPS